MSSLLRDLIAQLLAIDNAMCQQDRARRTFLAGLPAPQQMSAVNLLDYLEFRRHDLRHAQRLLEGHGLSSLGRTESHVRDGLNKVIRAVQFMTGNDWTPPPGEARPTLADGEALLARHTRALFGPNSNERSARIMVTMPTEASTDYALVRDLVSAGMDCMRINCAHDGPDEWGRMVAHVRQASVETGRPCTICMDIAGPKLRTAAIVPGPAVQKLKPELDAWGRVSRPAMVALVPASLRREECGEADAVVIVDRAVPASVGLHDEIEFVDARDRPRVLTVFARQGELVFATLPRTAYVVPGTRFRMTVGGQTEIVRVVDVPVREQALTLKVGEVLALTREEIPGHPAVRDALGAVSAPAQIGVTLGDVFGDVQSGESIWFDDGRIGGRITTTSPDRILVEITHARPEGEKLLAGKGINLPDTNLRLGALTDKDVEDLPFVVAHADLIGYSFVRRVSDVRELQERLAALGGQHIGIVLKIETRQAFEALPLLLLACMRTERFGVMIARGDLAIECGYERMAEVQEEILWIAEAAHTPVIWATQVLETLAKTGLPSRAEVTDAAMSERAECVMLNKGPFILEAVSALNGILRRMQAHQTKKRAMLRPLHVAGTVDTDTLL